MGKTALLDSLNTALNAFIDSTEELRAEDAKTSHIVQFSPSVFTLQKSTSGISAFSDEEASKISKDARVLADALIRTSKGGYKRVPGNPSALWCSSYDRAQNFVSRLNVLLEKTNEGAPRFETGHSIGVATSDTDW